MKKRKEKTADEIVRTYLSGKVETRHAHAKTRFIQGRTIAANCKLRILEDLGYKVELKVLNKNRKNVKGATIPEDLHNEFFFSWIIQVKKDVEIQKRNEGKYSFMFLNKYAKKLSEIKEALKQKGYEVLELKRLTANFRIIIEKTNFEAR